MDEEGYYKGIYLSKDELWNDYKGLTYQRKYTASTTLQIMCNYQREELEESRNNLRLVK